jgi:hypothetical protein
MVMYLQKSADSLPDQIQQLHFTIALRKAPAKAMIVAAPSLLLIKIDHVIFPPPCDRQCLVGGAYGARLPLELKYCAKLPRL